MGTGDARGRGESAGLDQDTVVSAAMALIDAEGLDAFSMRGLAKVLDVSPGALYWHAATKADLLALVLARVLGDAAPLEEGEWPDLVAGLARRYRRVLHAHPSLAPLLTTTLVSNQPRDLPVAESMLAALHRGGFGEQSLVDAYNVVIGAIGGFVGMEMAVPHAGQPEDWVETLEAAVRQAAPTELPTIAANRGILANRAFLLRWEGGATRPMDDAFEALIRVLVAGLPALHG